MSYHNRIARMELNESDGGYDFNLTDLQNKLKSIKYYGTVTLVWQDGEIVLIREERTLKPGMWDRFI